MKVKPSYIILEVGLGGRLDATNIIDPNIAIVTTIDLDHQSFLGNTREVIGIEKAGIFRNQTPAIIGEVNPPDSVLAFANKIEANLYKRDDQFWVETGIDTWQWKSADTTLNHLIIPYIPTDNVATALMALNLVDIKLSEKNVNKWIEQTKVPGRMEFFYRECTVILDVAHNPQSARYLAKKISDYVKMHKQCHVFAVCSMLDDKDIHNSLLPFVNIFDTWQIARLSTNRAANMDKIRKTLVELTVNPQKINCFDNIPQAFKIACQNAKADDLIVVFGSFYTVAEIRPLLI